MTKLRATSFSASDGVKFITVTDDYTISASDMASCGHLIVLADGSSDAFDITLPSDAEAHGKMLHILASDVTNAVAVLDDGTQTAELNSMGEYYWRVFETGGGGVLINNAEYSTL